MLLPPWLKVGKEHAQLAGGLHGLTLPVVVGKDKGVVGLFLQLPELRYPFLQFLVGV
jgi:hypothetical protein